MSRLQLRPVGAIKLIIFATSAFIIGNVVFLFLRCPQVNMAGQVDPDHHRYIAFFIHVSEQMKPIFFQA